MPKFTLKPALLCSLLSIIVLLWLNRQYLPAEYLGGGLSEMAAGVNRALGGISGIAAVNILVLVLFWGSLGLGCYWLVIQVANFLIKYRNELVIERRFGNRGDAKSRQLNWLWRLGAWAALALAAWLSLALLGIWSGLFGSGLNAQPLGWPTLITAVLALAANLYLLFFLLRLALSRSW